MQGGEVLRVVATDPGSMLDFKAFALRTGNQLLESNEIDGTFYYLIRKS
jgi:tRNA 2-thiouridine synthesizing protein A